MTRKGTWFVFLLLLVGAVVLLLGGCAAQHPGLVVVNERFGYAKVLKGKSYSTLLQAVKNARIVPGVRTFADLHGEGYWGGRMYQVYLPIQEGVSIPMFTFDSSGYFVEDQSGPVPVVRALNSEAGSLVYRLLSPGEPAMRNALRI